MWDGDGLDVTWPRTHWGEELAEGCLEEVGKGITHRVYSPKIRSVWSPGRLETQAIPNSSDGRRKGKEITSPVIRRGRRILTATGPFGHFSQMIIYLKITDLCWYAFTRNYPQCKRLLNSEIHIAQQTLNIVQFEILITPH